MSTEKKPHQQQHKKETINPLAVAKLLGPSNPKLDHLIRFLNSVRGTDKVLMVSFFLCFDKFVYLPLF